MVLPMQERTSLDKEDTQVEWYLYAYNDQGMVLVCMAPMEVQFSILGEDLKASRASHEKFALSKELLKLKARMC